MKYLEPDVMLGAVRPLADLLEKSGLLSDIERATTVVALDAIPSDPYIAIHYDLHIEKVAAALDRCLSLREEWDRLRTEGIIICLELNEHFKLYEISLEEIRLGLWDLPAAEARALYESQMQFGGRLAEAMQQSNRRSPLYEPGEITAEKAFRIRRGYNNAQAMFRQVADSERDWTLPDGSGDRKRKVDWVKLDEQLAADRDLLIEDALFRADISRLAAEIERNERLLVAARLKHEASPAEKASRIRRLEAAHETAKQKLALSQDAGSPLNYGVRAGRLADRIGRDLSSLRVHCAAMRRGLRAVFGFEANLPTVDASIDELYSFLHQSIEFLSFIESHEVNQIVRISLAAKLGAQFPDLLSGRRVEFDVSDQDLPSFSSIRLQGLSLMSVGKNLLTTKATLTPPIVSKYSHSNGSSGEISGFLLTGVSQPAIHTDDPGRVRDSVGFPMLQNIGPAGRWSLILDRNADPTVLDLLLELRVRGVQGI